MKDHQHYLDLLEKRSALLRIKFGMDCEQRALDEIEEIRLRAVRFELDIIDYDSPHGQWLDGKLREAKIGPYTPIPITRRSHSL